MIIVPYYSTKISVGFWTSLNILRKFRKVVMLYKNKKKVMSSKNVKNTLKLIK